MPPEQVRRICIGARMFALLVIGAPILWYRDEAGLVAMVVLGGVWATASLRSDPWKRAYVAPLAEAAAVGLVVGISLTASAAMVLALALPPFLAAIRGGLRLTVSASVVQAAVLVGVAVSLQLPVNTEEVLNVFTWVMGGLGLGLIGSFVHATAVRDADELASYLDAQRLIRQLLDLSGDLSSGLDVTSLAGSVVSDVRDVLPTSALGLYLPRGELLMPLVTTVDDPDEELDEAESLGVEAWARNEPIVHGHCFAFPLGEAAVVAGLISRKVELPPAEVERSIARLGRDLQAKAVQLDTALLFSDFRDLASADVRQRLAREMHDGVAQDIASLGYLVDALAARPADDKQAAQLSMLRERITKIVAEVRQSVLTLRTSIGESQSLGAAIGSVARHLSESSGIPIQVTLDEQSTRLRAEVEAELFRIAQEAMNNAIKHARCSTIEVICQVHAPRALITVSDDGRGLQEARSDSHGLKIMRERARLVGADLSIADGPVGGLMVTVRLGGLERTVPRPTDPERVTS